jgi:hypothetical protein
MEPQTKDGIGHQHGDVLGRRRFPVKQPVPFLVSFFGFPYSATLTDDFRNLGMSMGTRWR